MEYCTILGKDMSVKRVITERDEQGKILKYEVRVDDKPVPDGHKYCNACKVIKPVTDWTAKGTRCRQCAAELSRQAYHRIKNDPEKLSARYKADTDRRKKTKQQCVEYKCNVCYDCNKSFPTVVYDFHHLDPSEKDFSIGQKSFRSFEDLKEELDKCVMLCSNCHRIRHWDD
jgi:hypothetical protein